MRKLALVISAVVFSSVIAVTQAEAEIKSNAQSESLWVIAEKYETTITNMNAVKSEVIHHDKKMDQLLVEARAFKKVDE
ncbi:hypothetical protein [Macrococcus lamae]|uniref:Uncharacterized protein n=1 Tax=Macrococcus lamae TaxID=198484 RepID=A0A4R6BTV1_9STAP|nr:hypothetical protein [Macrococcus lamae]TDM10510.1 hypothetical protein ERX29_06580 [Macrococcus lamae]